MNPIRKTFIKRSVTDGIFYLAGCLLYALSVDIFTAPNHIAPGGLTGVATLANFLFSLPIGATMLVMNIPLMIASWRRLSLGFTIRSAIISVVLSLCIDGLAPFVPAFHGDQILTVVFGGVLAGLGLGLIYMRGGTTGGSVLIARLLEQKFAHIPAGRLVLAVDGVVVAGAALVYRNVESALYAIVTIYVSSVLMDSIIYGRNKGKMLLIMTNQEQEVTEGILRSLKRGVTKLQGAGAYSGQERKILLCAVRPPEVYTLRRLVYDLDPTAFMIVVSTDEVLGEGFVVNQLENRTS